MLLEEESQTARESESEEKWSPLNVERFTIQPVNVPDARLMINWLPVSHTEIYTRIYF